MLLAMVVIAPKPIPTQVLTVTIDTTYPFTTAPIVVSALAPSGSQLFEDEKEILASIITFNYGRFVQSIGMTTVSSKNL